MRYQRSDNHGRPAIHKPGTCDRCAGSLDKESGLSLYKPAFFRFAFQGGCDSIFGDGCWIEAEFCRGCIEQVFGPYIRRQPNAENLPKAPVDEYGAVTLPKRNGPDFEPPIVLQCDRCGHELDSRFDFTQWLQAFTIRYFTGSNNNLFDSGELMECDVCEPCVHHLMGAYMRITQDYAAWEKQRPHRRPRWAYRQSQLENEWHRRDEEDERL